MPLLNQTQIADDGNRWTLEERLSGPPPLWVESDEVLELATPVTYPGMWVQFEAAIKRNSSFTLLTQLPDQLSFQLSRRSKNSQQSVATTTYLLEDNPGNSWNGNGQLPTITFIMSQACVQATGL